MPSPAPLYDPDLAQIHVDGYGFHWEGATASLLQWLEDLGVPRDGRVVDLGCGGGQWLGVLSAEGYTACGIDVSESMTRLAAQNAPQAEVLCESFDRVAIPDCDAVTSLGEPINYLSSEPAIRRTIKSVFKALSPGGLFVFDARHPANGPTEPSEHCKLTSDWCCHARIEENPQRNELTRHITTFRLLDDGTYRRREETHCLKVFSRAEMVAWLREVGFRVRTKQGYGDYRLGPRQSVFVCRKPKR